MYIPQVQSHQKNNKYLVINLRKAALIGLRFPFFISCHSLVSSTSATKPFSFFFPFFGFSLFFISTFDSI